MYRLAELACNASFLGRALDILIGISSTVVWSGRSMFPCECPIRTGSSAEGDLCAAQNHDVPRVAAGAEMMSAVLMDTNALIWFMNGDPLDGAALVAIVNAQNSHGIYVSPIYAWEAALAVKKRKNQPDLGGRDAARWFRAVLKVPGVKLASPGKRIAIEVANVPAIFGRGDPGDCFIIATAHSSARRRLDMPGHAHGQR